MAEGSRALSTIFQLHDGAPRTRLSALLPAQFGMSGGTPPADFPRLGPTPPGSHRRGAARLHRTTIKAQRHEPRQPTVAGVPGHRIESGAINGSSRYP
jgi:hypothetical protein